MKINDITDAAVKIGGDFFAQWLEFILKWEVVTDRNGNIKSENDPDDPGGLTFAGIDQRSHPDFDYKNPQHHDVALIYRLDYWDKIKADSLQPLTAMAVANFAVNTGVSRAAKMLQSSINAINITNLRVAVDGIIGPKTIAAANQIDDALLSKFVIDTGDYFYITLAKKNKIFKKFLKGWLNRNTALRKLCS